MTPATAILIPVLNRPEKVAPLVANIEAMTPEPHSILFIASKGDDAEIEALSRETSKQWGVTHGAIDEPGTWARKINAGFAWTDEPFVFLAADDLRFHDGWLANAYRATTIRQHKGDPFPSVIGTNDKCNPRTYEPGDPRYPHSTHTLVRRSYIDETGGVIDRDPGIVLNPDYPHDFADDELVQTAKFRGVYAHAPDSIVEHRHPLCGTAPMDDTYALGMSVGPRAGARLFRQRKHLWDPAVTGRAAMFEGVASRRARRRG